MNQRRAKSPRDRWETESQIAATPLGSAQRGIRAGELRPDIEVTVVLADAFPNYSICGLPFRLSGDTEDWRQLVHHTELDGIELGLTGYHPCMAQSTGKAEDVMRQVV